MQWQFQAGLTPGSHLSLKYVIFVNLCHNPIFAKEIIISWSNEYFTDTDKSFILCNHAICNFISLLFAAEACRFCLCFNGTCLFHHCKGQGPLPSAPPSPNKGPGWMYDWYLVFAIVQRVWMKENRLLQNFYYFFIWNICAGAKKTFFRRHAPTDRVYCFPNKGLSHYTKEEEVILFWCVSKF
jgi:hypothetical protein